MSKRSSPSRIKTHRVYTAWEAANALGVHRQTVLRWINLKGLPADKSAKPWLIEGTDLKAFLGHRQRQRKCKLALHHCYCLGCRGPREPDGRIADYVQQTPATGMLTGLCPSCGSLVNKVIRRADLDAIRTKIDVTIQRASPRIVSPADALLNVTFEEDAETHAKTHRK